MCIDMALPSIAGVIILGAMILSRESLCVDLIVYFSSIGILLGQKVVPNNADALKLAAIIVTNTVYELGLMFLLGTIL